jgi:hypothetical protein
MLVQLIELRMRLTGQERGGPKNSSDSQGADDIMSCYVVLKKRQKSDHSNRSKLSSSYVVMSSDEPVAKRTRPNPSVLSAELIAVISKLSVTDALAAQAAFLQQLHEANTATLESEHRASTATLESEHRASTATLESEHRAELRAVNIDHQAALAAKDVQIHSILHDPRGVIQPPHAPYPSHDRDWCQFCLSQMLAQNMLVIWLNLTPLVI